MSWTNVRQFWRYCLSALRSECAFDEIASPMKIRTESDWLVAVVFGGDIGPRPLPDGQFSNPVAEAILGMKRGLDGLRKLRGGLRSRCRSSHTTRRLNQISQHHGLPTSSKKCRDKHLAYRGVRCVHVSLDSLSPQHIITWTLRK